MNNNIQLVKETLKLGIPDALIEINKHSGDTNHLNILIASDIFIGKMLLEQHQTVMTILTELLKEKIHAVKLRTLTHEQYKKQGENND